MPKTEKEIREKVASNLVALRKRNGLTQSELAERINYSDKSVSKWERGEAIPDFYILTQLAEIYGVGTDDFLADNEEEIKINVSSVPLSGRSKLIITALAAGLVWLVVAVAFFVLTTVGVGSEETAMIFYCAVPATAIALIVFTEMWFSKIWSFLSVTLLIWSLAYGIFAYIRIDSIDNIFAVAGVLQVLVSLWYLLMFLRRREKNKKNSD